MLVDAPRKLKLAHTSHVARVEHREGGEGGEVTSRDFDLDDAAQKKSFLDLVRDHDIDTIHTQEPSLEDVFLKVTGQELA